MGVETKRMSSSRRWLAPGIVAALVTSGGFAPEVEAQLSRGAASVDVEGTQFKVTLPDGRVLRSPELVGAVLDLRSGVRVRIDAVEEDRDSRGGPLWLHTLSMQQADGTWASLCLVGPDGRRAGFPVPGRATAHGTVAEAEPGVFELTCTGGAQAKCVRFGYRPWEMGPDGRPMRVRYNACVRMVRADYGGDGHGTTRDGMLIDIYDAWKIQTAELQEGHDFEAGWSAEARCACATSGSRRTHRWRSLSGSIPG
jgi:ADYC domain